MAPLNRYLINNVEDIVFFIDSNGFNSDYDHMLSSVEMREQLSKIISFSNYENIDI